MITIAQLIRAIVALLKFLARHPVLDLEAAIASGAHFARKFQEGSEALDLIDNEVLGRRSSEGTRS